MRYDLPLRTSCRPKHPTRPMSGVLREGLRCERIFSAKQRKSKERIGLELKIELKIDRNLRYRIRELNNFQEEEPPAESDQSHRLSTSRIINWFAN